MTDARQDILDTLEELLDRVHKRSSVNIPSVTLLRQELAAMKLVSEDEPEVAEGDPEDEDLL